MFGKHELTVSCFHSLFCLIICVPFVTIECGEKKKLLSAKTQTVLIISAMIRKERWELIFTVSWNSPVYKTSPGLEILSLGFSGLSHNNTALMYAYTCVKRAIWICSSTGLLDLDIISSDGEYHTKGYLLRQWKAVCQLSLLWSGRC